MSESLGALVDRLSITNLKIWFLQEWVHEAVRMSPAEFQGQTHAEIQAKLQKIGQLNLERNRIMTEIDACLDRAVREGKAVVDPRIKLVD